MSTYNVYITDKKEWIRANCFTKAGRQGLNNRICLESWWINKNIQDIRNDIIQSTKYLSSDVTFPERVYHIVNDLSEVPLCKQCGIKHVNFDTFGSGYYDYCSKYCSTQSEERNEKIKSKNDYTKLHQQIRESNLKKYGVEHYFQTKESVEKIKQTKLEKYGDANYNNMEKNKQTVIDRYGVNCSLKIPHILEHIEEKRTEKRPELRDKNWLIEQNKTKSVTEIAKQLNVTYRAVWLWFIKFQIPIKKFPTKYGKQQKEVYDFIESLGITNLNFNDRTTIKPKEIDIYLPDYKLAIEYNGCHWHRNDENRHAEKFDICKENNIKLLQIWDHEWIFKTDIVKSIIKSNLHLNETIYARKCEIIELESNTYSDFLESNHIQGSINSPIRYGLSYNDGLVAVMGFGKSRFNKKYSHELLRFCNKLNHNVVGGFSKLFKHILKNHSIESVQTFCDLRYFDGLSYTKSGFSFSHRTRPGYFYYKDGMIENRQKFQKHKLKNVLEFFDETLTERENCFLNGWNQIHDSGQFVYHLFN